EAGLDALVEIHAASELDQALEAGATIVGINARDLDTFETDLAGALAIRKECPPGVLTVAESAIRERADVELIEKAGFDAILVGETLVRAADPGEKLRELLGADSEPTHDGQRSRERV